MDAREKGLISVIIPVHNSGAWLRECLDSVRAQSYKNLEILVVDDGSTDDSGKICDEFAALDDRFIVIHQENAGVSAARNLALDRARGEWLGFVDSDDIIDPEMFRRLYDLAMETGSDIAACSFHRFEDEQRDEIFPEGILTPREALQRLLVDGGLTPHICNKIYRDTVFEGIRFPIGCLYEDLRIMHLLFQQAGRIAVIEDTLYNYRIHGGSNISSTRGRYARERIESRELRSEDMRGTEFYPEARLRVLNCVRTELLYMLEDNDVDRAFFRELVEKGRAIFREYGHRMKPGIRARYFILLYFTNMYWRLNQLKNRKRKDRGN